MWANLLSTTVDLSIPSSKCAFSQCHPPVRRRCTITNDNTRAANALAANVAYQRLSHVAPSRARRPVTCLWCCEPVPVGSLVVSTPSGTAHLGCWAEASR